MKQSRSISLNLKDNNIAHGWDLVVSSEAVDPNQVSADLIAQALIVVAVENLIKRNEQAPWSHSKGSGGNAIPAGIQTLDLSARRANCGGLW